MGQVRWISVGAAALAGVAFSLGQAVACPAYEQARKVLGHKDVERLAAAHDAMRKDHRCGPHARLVGRVVVVRRAKAARRLAPAAAQAALEQALKRARPWQALAALGALHLRGKRYGRAKKLLTEAIVDMGALSRLERKLGLGPSKAQGERIAALQTEALLLSQSMEGAASRGECFIRSRGGFTVKPAAVPIRFATDSSEIAGKAGRDVEILYRCLSETRIQRLVLVGHTDIRGSDAYNLELSRRRAESVRSALRRLGLPARVTVEVVAMGKREPFKASDRGRYSLEEQWRLDRRVELRIRRAD
ncbi:MAG: OmpA family protein [Neomegalonema sp.]|nr:OmpA family protein [Neomegalonema sp.]